MRPSIYTFAVKVIVIRGGDYVPRKGENIYKRKDGRWEGRYIKSRNDKKAVYGYVYAKTYSEVKKKLNSKRAEIFLEESNSLKISLKDASFLNISNLWLISIKSSVKESTWIKYRNTLNIQILPRIGMKNISVIDYETIFRMCNEMLQPKGCTNEGLTSKTVSDALTIVKAIIKYADRMKFITDRTALDVSVKLTTSKLRVVIVSLARAGIPIGILLKRYHQNKYDICINHYAISIIRGRGIDKNAVNYILERHNPKMIQFVDGWIGKGAILTQLREALKDYPELDSEIAVVSDPANLTRLCGTHEDILIPSACLNATVTGLISRTFLREDIIGEHEFHGAAYYSELSEEDLSEQFLNYIERYFNYTVSTKTTHMDQSFNGMDVVKKIAFEYLVDDINYIKPGIGEATRVLLRRIPWKIIVNPDYSDTEELNHVYQLAEEKGIPCEISKVWMGKYKVCGIIKKIADV